MSKKKRVKKDAFANGRLVMTACYNYGIDDLKAISTESNEEGLSIHKDGRMYYCGRILSEQEEKSSYHQCSELPRFNTMFIIDADKSEMAKIYQIWKALTTMNSYILFDFGKGKVYIALYAKIGQEQLEEMLNYHEYYFAKKLIPVSLSKDHEDNAMFKEMQALFDVQLYNEYEGSQLFAHTLRISGNNQVMPFFIDFEVPSLKYFRFDEVA